MYKRDKNEWQKTVNEELANERKRHVISFIDSWESTSYRSFKIYYQVLSPRENSLPLNFYSSIFFFLLFPFLPLPPLPFSFSFSLFTSRATSHPSLMSTRVFLQLHSLKLLGKIFDTDGTACDIFQWIVYNCTRNKRLVFKCFPHYMYTYVCTDVE